MNAEALGGRILRAAVQPPTAVEVRWAGRLQGACLLGALGLTLLFTARTLAPAFRAPNVVQDDARLHVFWMARFRDPALFPNDLIADYYQALDPPGYRALYWTLSLAIDPLLASKLLPILLGLLTALFTFLLARRLHASPAGAFLGTALLSWYLWQIDDLASATPRAFMSPFLAAILWALAAGRLALCVGLIGLAALFFPATGAIGAGMLGLRLLHVRGLRPTLSRQLSGWLAFLAAVLLVVVAQLPLQAATSRFGKVVSATQAAAMPEFGPGGRSEYFGRSPYGYWLESGRSGLDLRIPEDQPASIPILLGCLLLTALLPLLVGHWRRGSSTWWVSPGCGHLGILLQLFAVSFGFYFLAHLMLFQLHYPNRFIRASLPLVVAVGAGHSLGILLDLLGPRVGARLARGFLDVAGRRAVIATVLALLVGIALVQVPARQVDSFRRDRYPTISEYLRTRPKDFLVAGAPGDLDGVPTFANRAVLASHETALAFHLGYYGEIRRRVEDLIPAYYAETPAEAAAFAERYGVDVFLISRAAYEESTFAFAWTGVANGTWEPYTSAVARRLRDADSFILPSLIRRCAVLEERGLAVIPTRCIRREARPSRDDTPETS